MKILEKIEEIIMDLNRIFSYKNTNVTITVKLPKKDFDEYLKQITEEFMGRGMMVIDAVPVPKPEKEMRSMEFQFPFRGSIKFVADE